jgi:hypothetical protein
MVLASGCGSKTLVRIGGGSLKSLVVFLVMGVAAFATLKGITAVVRVGTVDRVARGHGLRHIACGLAGRGNRPGPGRRGWCWAGCWAARWCSGPWPGADFRTFDNLLAGLGIGGVVVAMWWVSGHLGYVAEHPDTLQEALLPPIPAGPRR